MYGCHGEDHRSATNQDFVDVHVITVTSQWVLWRFRSPASRLFAKPFVQAQTKENIKALRPWPLRGEFTGDRWIPRTRGQWRRKCFHFMTSSWFGIAILLYLDETMPKVMCVCCPPHISCTRNLGCFVPVVTMNLHDEGVTWGHFPYYVINPITFTYFPYVCRKAKMPGLWCYHCAVKQKCHIDEIALVASEVVILTTSGEDRDFFFCHASNNKHYTRFDPWKLYRFTATSNYRHTVSKYRSIKCLFNSLFRLTTNKHQRPELLSLCEGNTTVTGGFPHKGTVTWKMFPIDDVLMIPAR